MSILTFTKDWLAGKLEHLSERERMMVNYGTMGGGLLILILISLVFSGAISQAERRVVQKTSQLTELLALQGVYQAKKNEETAQLRQIRNSRVKLVSLVESVAQETGVTIAQMQPDVGPQDSKGIVESTLLVRFKGLSIDRLEEFLSKLNNRKGMVFVSHLEINRPYRSKKLDVSMTVITYKLKS